MKENVLTVPENYQTVPLLNAAMHVEIDIFPPKLHLIVESNRIKKMWNRWKRMVVVKMVTLLTNSAINGESYSETDEGHMSCKTRHAKLVGTLGAQCFELRSRARCALIGTTKVSFCTIVVLCQCASSKVIWDRATDPARQCNTQQKIWAFSHFLYRFLLAWCVEQSQ